MRFEPARQEARIGLVAEDGITELPTFESSFVIGVSGGMVSRVPFARRDPYFSYDAKKSFRSSACVRTGCGRRITSRRLRHVDDP